MTNEKSILIELEESDTRMPLLIDQTTIENKGILIGNDKIEINEENTQNGKLMGVVEVRRTQSSSNNNTSIKLGVLIWLTVQNAVHALLLRYSRVRDVKEMYFSTVAVFWTEVIKLFVCLLVVFHTESADGFLSGIELIKRQVFDQPKDTLKVCIPSMLYILQNNLFYTAASHLNAATFMIVSQLKIFSAAIFSIILLNRSLLRAQWIALIILFIGVCLVQMQPEEEPKEKNIERINFLNEQNVFTGFIAASIACGLSGFSGVFFEKILKGSAPVSLWMRNIQMAVFSIPSSFLATLIQDGTKISEHGFMYGWDKIVWLTAFWYAVGGLSVAVCLKYADNIAKNFATSVAIILATLGSIQFFGFKPSLLFTLGASLVILSIFLYSSSITIFRFFGINSTQTKNLTKKRRRISPEKEFNLIKYISLLILVLQNTSQVLIIRYATTRNPLESPPFIKTVAVFFNELLKLFTSLILFFLINGDLNKSFSLIKKHFILNFFDTLKVGVPAFIYVIQNFLLYIAVENLDAGTYMVTYQLKILTTAIFTVLMLKRKLSIQQWIALLVLIIGVAIVQISANNNNNKIIIITTTISPIKIIQLLKVKKNTQLAFLSIPISLLVIWGFMQGFDLIVWIAVLLQAFGGLIVAIVIKYADNILKAFGTSVSIVVATIASILIFSKFPSLLFIGGAVLVIGAVILYGIFPYKKIKDLTVEEEKEEEINEKRKRRKRRGGRIK
ncbi:hypothetical protein Mgra_00001991 [Meloidogyne graminicola]|uniref:UDP-galactose transporter n=1 Tax=Meloidogyne graminicola TaxID=189291 RepID=A0A8T0A0G9_9BILA|nr:hypothetical protein Mgra_00001991 [Meloidogyne graminicola]